MLSVAFRTSSPLRAELGLIVSFVKSIGVKMKASSIDKIFARFSASVTQQDKPQHIAYKEMKRELLAAILEKKVEHPLVTYDFGTAQVIDSRECVPVESLKELFHD
jgi:hypothetical protein